MIHADPNLYLHNNFVYIDRTAYIKKIHFCFELIHFLNK